MRNSQQTGTSKAPRDPLGQPHSDCRRVSLGRDIADPPYADGAITLPRLQLERARATADKLDKGLEVVKTVENSVIALADLMRRHEGVRRRSILEPQS